MQATTPDATMPELLDRAYEVISQRLPPEWTVAFEPMAGDPSPRLVLRDQSAYAAVFVTLVRERLTPKAATDLLGNSLVKSLRVSTSQQMVVIASYLSARTQEVLRAEGISFVDLTGNVHLTAKNPGLFVHTFGADADPSPSPRGRSGLRGAKTGVIVRALASIRPPFTLTELAKAVNTDVAYVSQVLSVIEDGGFVTRKPRGPIEAVDWRALLRARAETQSLLARIGATRYAAPSGAEQALVQLAQQQQPTKAAVLSGSYAARRYRPLAAPGFLTLYTPDAADLATQLNLLPTDRPSFDVLLIQPKYAAPVLGAQNEGGQWLAHVTTIAIDCLSGVGRMQSEGEAVLDWMEDNQPAWRKSSGEIGRWSDPWEG